MLAADAISFSYSRTEVLSDLSMTFTAGESVALVGPSGCGKTTFLYCLSGLLAPASGTVSFQGEDIAAGGEQGRALLRRTAFGFVFQSADLVSELTVRENVALPLDLAGVARGERDRRVGALLERLGLDQVADRRPARVSGGQRQRAAVARAVVHRPAVVFADEPTGALDSANGATVMELLLDLAKEQGTTIVLVTHDNGLARLADRSVEMLDGRILNDSGAAPSAGTGFADPASPAGPAGPADPADPAEGARGAGGVQGFQSFQGLDGVRTVNGSAAAAARHLSGEAGV